MFKTIAVTSGAAVMAIAMGAQASTIGYWQLQDGAAGATASTIATVVNSGTLSGVASGQDGGPAPKFSADVPGGIIIDGVGGPIVNASNTASLLFDNTGGTDGSGTLATTTGGKVTIADPGGVDSLLKPRNFTIEGFIKVNATVNWPTVLGKSRNNTANTSWTIDLNGDSSLPIDPNSQNNLRARVDSQPGTTNSGTGWNQGFSTPAQLDGGQWHHFAMSYEDATRNLKLYFDYQEVRSSTTVNPIVYDDLLLYFGNLAGGRALDGWLDEIRLTGSVLNSDQFLRVAVIPEPASLAMIAGVALVALRRR